jgi:hypothetical protein
LTSARQRRANQANAKASKGPKTKAGKARSAQNALRHGLCIPVCREPSLLFQAEELALKLAGPDPDDALLDRARAVAEAQVDLNRVRARRNALVARLMADPEYKPLSTYKKQLRIMRMIDRFERISGKPFDLDDIGPLPDFKPLEGDKKFATVVEDRVRELAALDRYERRAISKRKSAIRTFDSAYIPATIRRRPKSIVWSAPSSPLDGAM